MSNYKEVEKLLYSGSHETRKTLNRSNKIIPVEILNEIETKGITSERLLELDVPVLKYWTQITIHGQFPKLDRNLYSPTGYKSVFQNKNKSVGIRYLAVDYAKKKRIFDIITQYYNFNNDWIIFSDAQEIYAEKRIRVKSKTEYKEALEQLKKVCSGVINSNDNIKDNLFYGGISFFLGECWGQYYCIAQLHIGAIFEKNINQFLELFLKDNIQNIYETANHNQKTRDDRFQKEEEERELERKKSAEKTKELLRQEGDKMKSLGFIKKQVEIFDGLVCVTIIPDYLGSVEIRTGIYFKEKNKRKFSLLLISLNDFNDLKNPLVFNFDKTRKNDFPVKLVETRRVKGDLVNAWFGENCISEPPKKPIKTSKKTSKKTKQFTSNNNGNNNSNNDSNNGTMKVVDYSELSIAVIGNTKPHKDQLKQLGGRFNYRLSCGVGWIFSKKIENKVRDYVNNNQLT